MLDSCEVESKGKKEKNFLISKNLLLRYVKCVKNNFLKQNAIFFLFSNQYRNILREKFN